MLFSLVFATLSLLIGFVNAGSRLWEANIQNHRNGTLAWDPRYHNETLVWRRAASTVPGSSSTSTHLWPDKTLTFAFADTTSKARLKGIFHEAQERWNLLKQHGFKYKEVSLSKCNSMRAKCLVIIYNDHGRLASTVALPPVDANDESYRGPIMHLSDSNSIGNLDANVNAAHALGHAWGLFHEHQVPRWWKTSPEHQNSESGWTGYYGEIFHTNQFHCENLKDYDEAMARVKANANAPFGEATRLCTSRPVAAKYQFSAMEWLPVGGEPMDVDSEFDKDSLMLYPSGAGGKGDATMGSDNRQPILTYTEGRLIPIRYGPSSADYEKLISLYGAGYRGESLLLNSKGHRHNSLFSEIRRVITRSGDTLGGLC